MSKKKQSPTSELPVNYTSIKISTSSKKKQSPTSELPENAVNADLELMVKHHLRDPLRMTESSPVHVITRAVTKLPLSLPAEASQSASAYSKAREVSKRAVKELIRASCERDRLKKENCKQAKRIAYLENGAVAHKDAGIPQWMKLKKMVVAAQTNKNVQTLEILRNVYKDNHVICITEASVTFLDDARAIMGKKFMIPTPTMVDSKRDQNSFLLLSKDFFGNDKFAAPVDITAKAHACFPTNGKLALGKSDLYLLYVQNMETPAKPSFVIGSFHGDTPGLLTIPMIHAVSEVMARDYPQCQLILGLDANCYNKKSKKKRLFVDDLSACLDKHNLSSCFGSPINKDVVTTCMARTFLQPQMNKANLAATRTLAGDVNPKDHIVFRNGAKVSELGATVLGKPKVDNTGKKNFVAQSTFPTLTFPSDHAIISAELTYGKKTSPGQVVRVVAWNIAAINNNPFEYWMDSISNGDPKVNAAEKAYTKLMTEAEKFVMRQKKATGSELVKVKDVFTKKMFDELKEEMIRQRGTSKDRWIGIEEVATAYEEQYANRSIVNGVLFDDLIGEKRLCSWPDRFTNTIRCFDTRGKRVMQYRPSVINSSCSPGLASHESRWKIWKEFMFRTLIRKTPEEEPRPVCDLLQLLPRKKYPQVTEEEARISMPLQVLCLAIFDFIMFYVVEFTSAKPVVANLPMMNAGLIRALELKDHDRPKGDAKSQAGELLARVETTVKQLKHTTERLEQMEGATTGTDKAASDSK